MLPWEMEPWALCKVRNVGVGGRLSHNLGNGACRKDMVKQDIACGHSRSM